MVKKFLKKRSKRMKCSTKYKIVKKVSDHHKKLKKEKRKHPEKFRKKTSDPGVPNSLPFKDKVIEEAVEAKRIREEAKEKRRDEMKERRRLQREGIHEKKRNIGESIIKNAEERGLEYEEKQKIVTETAGILTDKSAKAYYREFKKVVEAADVVLEVLDARDPLGTRAPQLESTVTMMPGKKLVLVLNKADLVPRENLEKWLKYLRMEHPTIVFKSSTQIQGNHLSQTSAKVLSSSEELLQSSRCLGADVLMQLLKNYCRNKGIKTAISVGVVGLPNVGKSSLINSLKRSKSCGVGSTPGFTKSMQEIILDSKIRLLDCPGIVLPGGDANDATAALRNAIKLENLEDPIKPVEAILARANKDQLMVHYRMPGFKDAQEFLALLAKRMGKLKKGGVPDKNMAARMVLHDWNVGRIKYYCQPPELVENEVGASIVTELAKEFDIDSLITDEGFVLSSLPILRPSETMVVESSGPVMQVKEAANEDDEWQDMDDEETIEENSNLDKNICINMDPLKKVETVVKGMEIKVRTPIAFDSEKMSLKNYQKKMLKKARKESNRNVKNTNELSEAFASFGGIESKSTSNEYNFDDFDMK